MEFLNSQVWLFYSVANRICLLKGNLLSLLMCIKIGVLFTGIRVLRLGVVVSAAAFINYGCRFKCLVGRFQGKAV